MCCVFFAESTIFACFHSVWMSFFILCSIVVTLLAFCTCQCDSNAHNFHLAFSQICVTVAINCRFLGIKKKPSLLPFAMIEYHTLRQSSRLFSLFFQLFSLFFKVFSLFFLCPSIGIFHCFIPTFHTSFSIRFFDSRRKGGIDGPVLNDIFFTLPITNR